MKIKGTMELDENSSKSKKNSAGRKTYFRIKSAGNARPEKQNKYRGP